jgi:hypothetical protein
VAAAVMALAVAVAAARTFQGAGGGVPGGAEFQLSRARQLFLDGFLDSARAVGLELDSSDPGAAELLDAIAAVDGANAALQAARTGEASDALDKAPPAYQGASLVATLRSEIARREGEASNLLERASGRPFQGLRLRPAGTGAFP